MQSKNQYKKPVEKGQDIYDLCIQEYGSINTVFLLLADNPHINLEDKLEPGEVIYFRVELPNEVSTNRSQMDFFRNNRIRVNTKETIVYSDGFTLLTNNGDAIVDDQQNQIGGFFTSDIDTPTPPIGITTNSKQIIITNAGDLITF